jgi:isopenicillin-N N-acyltransferase-like protein
MDCTAKFERELEVIGISGEASDRGDQIGTKYRDYIAEFVARFYEKFNALGITSKDEVLQHIGKYIPYIKDYSPEIAAEIGGVARGAERAYEEIIMLNLLEEVDVSLGIKESGLSMASSRCTAFAATGKATANGETYLGQSWDTDLESLEHDEGQLFNVKRNSEPDLLVYTYPGMLAAAGLNSAGIGISWNTVPPLEFKVGVPTYLIVAEILRQKTIGDAIAAILRANRAGCFNFVLADESEIYDIEATPSDVDITYYDKYMGHANHFISSKFKDRQVLSGRGASAAWACSFVRHNRMNKLLSDHCDSIDLNACMDALRDHVNYPKSICRHPDPAESNPEKNGITEASWVMVPAKREWWISYGPPCQNKFIKYTL